MNVNEKSKEVNRGHEIDLDIDLEEARRFLDLLGNGETEFTFQTFDDNKGRDDKQLARTVGGSLAQLEPQLRQWQANKQGVWVTVQQTEPGKRTASDVIGIRAIIADFDDGYPTNLPLPPSIRVETSPGKYQCLWLVTDWGSTEDAREEFRSVEQRLIDDYGADHRSVDLARVFRVPGFFHQKNPEKPFRSRLVEASGQRYSRTQILKAFPPIKIGRRRKSKEPPVYDNVRNALIDRNQLLNLLSPLSADDYDVWRTVGMVLKKEYGDKAFRFWKAWSATSQKYDPRVMRAKWESFDDEKYRGPTVGMGTLVKLAHEARESSKNDPCWVEAQKTRFDAIVKALPEDFPPELPDSNAHNAIKKLTEDLGLSQRGGENEAKAKAYKWPDIRKDGSRPVDRSQANIKEYLNVESITLHFDEFARKVHISGFMNYKVLDAEAFKQLKMALHRAGLTPEDKFLEYALTDIALQDRRHPLKEYLTEAAKGWDGIGRIDSWLIDLAGAEPTDLNRAIGKRVLMAAVARVFKPGVKFDQLLVLQGAQGAGKSTLVKTLAGEWFDDCLTLGMSSKEVIEQATGTWICEISELDGSKRERERIKAMLTRTTDRAALKYEKFASEVPRSFVMIGTTNQDEFINDPSGGRRFWPVKVTTVRLSELSAVRDQLWGEATHRVLKALESGELENELKLPEALWGDAAELQHKASFSDEIYETLAEALEDRTGFIATSTLFDVLGFPAEDRKSRFNQLYLSQIRGAMERLGWTYGREPAKPLGWTYGREPAKPLGWTHGREPTSARRRRGWVKADPEAEAVTVWEFDTKSETLTPKDYRPVANVIGYRRRS